MKRLTLLLTLAPGMALAHGAHAPLPEPAHAMTHAGPVLGAIVITLAIGLALAQRWRS